MNDFQNISTLVQRYVSKQSSIKHCLQHELINLSALSRKICAELDTDQFDAVLKACRRYQQRLSRLSSEGSAIANLLENARVQVKTKIVVATISRPRSLEKIDHLQREVRHLKGDFHLIEGQEVLTIVTNRRFVSQLRKQLKSQLLRLTEDLVQVCMIMDPTIETIPGVVAAVYGRLHEYGVNVREEMSCWSDIMFIIDEADLSRAMEALNI